MTISRLTALTDRVRRIDYCGIHVDIVATSKGLVRIGSIPDIAKFLAEHGIREEIVVLPDWEVSLAGDNRTGEEFVLWHGQSRKELAKKYVGQQGNVRQVQHHLGRIFPYFFDEKHLSIARTNWLASLFHPNIASPSYCNGGLEIQCSDSNIVISDEGRVIYEKLGFGVVANPDDEIEALLASVPEDKRQRDCLEVIPIGCGNGFYGTAANTIVRFDKHVIWIDPCGYPAHSLARCNVHLDDVTHLLFTHNHEDHVQGFTACLQRARIQKRRLNLLALDTVFCLLKELYAPLFPDLEDHVSVTPLRPGIPLNIGPIVIESRLNHHILPYGTVGLKISANGKSFGYSGDTKYDAEINSLLKREELMASWFAPCDLVFHEVEFDNPHSVHSHWKQVAALQRSISGQVLGYHAPYLENSPFQLAQEGSRYLL